MKLREKAKIVEGICCLGCFFLRLREDAGLSRFDSCSQLATIRHGDTPCLHGAAVQYSQEKPFFSNKHTCQSKEEEVP